ncbi:SDR family oxidoreductase [Rhizobiales bacterium]|uniref:SDR family NAD(P)-dependent oxidoreductase n=1 Tax=Hongsoonwoonella zoysiae TaxID=2821844 RepID=UPI00155F817B|nr:SDR family oxidoreductase [Hongsoonwoonella zoysiae]NRG17755.1 SDR family oxidoreductase [Hongsoonwoonella zoysiae]
MSEITIDFSGQTVLLTGGSTGIGYGIATAFAKANADLHIVALEEGLEDAVARLDRIGASKVTGHACDITDKARVEEVAATIGAVDVLINNAGLEIITPIDDPSDETEAIFRRIIDINIVGTYLVTRAVLRNMSAGGRIILTASVWGKSAIGEFSAYIASKHANIGFMRSIARELGPRGIRVNCVCPGWVQTGAGMKSLRNMSLRQERPEEDILAEVMATQCMPGLQQPDDVADLYVFLASSQARNITGQAINVDRGEFLG